MMKLEQSAFPERQPHVVSELSSRRLKALKKNPPHPHQTLRCRLLSRTQSLDAH